MKPLQKFNQYFKGSLSESETEDFTKTMVKDYFETEDRKGKWNKILESEHGLHLSSSSSPKPTSRKYRRLVITALASAASILFLLFAWFSYEQNNEPKHQQLLASYISTPFKESVSRKGPIEDLQNKAIGFYNAKEYTKAIPLFEKLNKLDESDIWAFYTGLCNLYVLQPDAAISNFDKVLATSNTLHGTEAHWFLGLAYTMKEDLTTAKKHLEVVANHSEYEKGWNVQKANTLLDAFEE